ncbi:hypothetical protein IV203_003715 [Nitzschia inconspicua]|uniref:Adhesin domain-containing protein n=1 Tax=Nitzschia inconspicua TaxID=303405 RepID=A0A9K3PR83_9STRA|nr:hypothetical protein IV203_003715 [Nitzschia inconspicua]
MSNLSHSVWRRWASYPLSYLQQGSTLSIRSMAPHTNLLIRPQWRNDGYLSFDQRNHNKEMRNDDNIVPWNLYVSKEQDKITSMGRPEAQISILLSLENDVNPTQQDHAELSQSIPIKDEDIKEDDVHDSGQQNHDLDGNPNLTIDVPEKLNLECELPHGGSIRIQDKIEGDVRLWTSSGSVHVKKLRGHAIDIVASRIFASHLLESQSLQLAVPEDGRIRVKRIHAGDMEIHVGTDKVVQQQNNDDNTDATESHDVLSYDDDDAGASCDISALYITGDAKVNVRQNANSLKLSARPQRQAVRIKSHHGHIHVESDTPIPTVKNAMTGEYLPAVDLGGVNGSCEVLISCKSQGDDVAARDDDSEATTACHIHFDSIVPDSVSVIQSEWGNVHVTVDRKVEADVRLLSPSVGISNVDVETLLLEDNEDGSLADEVPRMLQYLDNLESRKCDPIQEERIQILTKAFSERERPEIGPLDHGCEFVDGWVENTTSEPDSRFDRKLRGISSSSERSSTGGGKIRLEGAYNQALHGFQKGENAPASSSTSSSVPSFARPLLAVVTPGKIVLETLSWMGNIARRYGIVDEPRDSKDLGRQATRRKRLGDESLEQ